MVRRPARAARSHSARPRAAPRVIGSPGATVRRSVPSSAQRSVAPYAVQTRTPTSSHAWWMSSSEPSMQRGDSWWSMMQVVPPMRASTAPSLADQ
jgi:hypothetical protein